jgi:hypothetical protein
MYVPVVSNVRPPRFQNQEEVQIVETKYRVKVVGTSCDVPIGQQEYESPIDNSQKHVNIWVWEMQTQNLLSNLLNLQPF